MNLFEAKATLNISKSAEQLLLVKQLAKQLNEEIQKLEMQIEWEHEYKDIKDQEPNG